MIPFPDKKYQIIYADPPWPYTPWTYEKKHIKPINSYYPTMFVEEIKALNVPSDNNCWLILWTTAPKIQEGLDVLRAWGFNYRIMGIWDKGNGLGKFFRIYHEVILVGKKGKPTKPLFTVPSIFKEGRRKHSQKPVCVRRWIEQAFPDLSKIELFARERTPGWDAWGDEV